MPYENNNANVYNRSKIEFQDKSPFSRYLLNSVYQKDGEVEVYGKILAGEEGRIEQISILSNEMIACDTAFFNGAEKIFGDVTRESYHPYFCELFLDAKISKKLLEGLTEYVGTWCKIKLAFGNAIDKSAIKGTIVFCASPIERIWCGVIFSYVLKYSDDVPSILDKGIKKCKNFEEYINRINKRKKTFHQYNILPCIKNIEEISGRVYNAGQGNFILFKVNNVAELLFDVGESRLPKDGLSENSYIRENETEIIALEPQYVIISHWDIDHILGVYKFNDRVDYSFYRNSLWIAPDITELGNEVSVSAKRLCAYLFHENSITLIKNPAGCFCTIGDENSSFIKLWQGDCQADPGTKANNIGLIIEAKIRTNEKFQKLLFSGDCSYWHMSNKIFDEKYDFIVTAHHGAESAVRKDFEFKAPDATKGARAVICTGCNDYGHPHIEHLTELKYKEFDIYYTSACQYIGFSVSNEEKIKINRYPNKKEQNKIYNANFHSYGI